MSLLESVRHQHQKLLRLIGFLTLAEGENERRKLVARLREEFAAQEGLERSAVLEPLGKALEQQGPQADGRLRSLLEEAGDRIADIHDLFREIEMTGSAEELEAPLRELLRAIRNHIEEEEILFYPRIEASTPKEQSRRMEETLDRAQEEQAHEQAKRRVA